jgi:putative CocE/NonD family hydrolase
MNRCWALAIVIIALLAGNAVAAPRYDAAWWSDPDAAKTKETFAYREVRRTSFYLPMRDGVKLAVDLYLPADLRPGDRLPAILTQTRYWRRLGWHWPLEPLLGVRPEIEWLVRQGYALVRADVRGSGASFGGQPYSWAPDEVRDGTEIVDWIVRQPWSNGRVGSAGGSYEGTCAEFLATNRHPAVKAIAPLFALFDVYADIAFPGGIQLAWFTRTWQQGNNILDRNRPEESIWYARLLVDGVAAVDDDPGGRLRRAALDDHRHNYQVHDEVRRLQFRDDTSPGGVSADNFSPHRFLADLRASGVAIYSWSGWYDGAYAHSAIKRFLTIRGPHHRLTLGPWAHGGDTHVRPFEKSRPARFEWLPELKRFFDFHLNDAPTGIEKEPPVHYYTMGEDAWKSASDWPPPSAPLRLYLATNRALATRAPVGADGEDRYRVDLTAGTGETSRWRALAVSTVVRYPNRRAPDRRLLCYDSPPLRRAVEVTGHPLVTLFVAADASDFNVMAYLEDVSPAGDVALLSEGWLRALHRRLSAEPPPYRTPVPYRSFLRRDASPVPPGETAELTFDLLPLSYRFPAGHRIRLAVAGADADHFAILPGPPPNLRLQRHRGHASLVELPIVGSAPGTIDLRLDQIFN